jgi:hydroxypyruvate isomerase
MSKPAPNIRFAPNFYHLFLELPVRERFAAAAKIGCTAIEWHFPYELPKAELKSLLDGHGIEFTYCVVPADWAAGVRGLGAQPGKQDEFRRAADQALEYIQHCDFYSINVGAGEMPPGEERQRCVDTYVENLDYIAGNAGGHRCKFLLEPVCTQRAARWPMKKMAEARAIAEAVGRPNVGLVYDTFHMRYEETGTLTDIMDEFWPLIGYVQIGNPPGRNEPGVGELDLLWLAERAVGKGYRGAIGMELDPSRDTWNSLLWMNRYGYAVDPDNRL